MSVVTKAWQAVSRDTWTLSLQASAVVGFGNSLTVTSKQQVPMLPCASSTWKQFVVVPIGNSEPDGRPAVWMMLPPLAVKYETEPFHIRGLNGAEAKSVFDVEPP